MVTNDVFQLPRTDRGVDDFRRTRAPRPFLGSAGRARVKMGLGEDEKSVVVILEGNEGKMPMPEVKAKDNG